KSSRGIEPFFRNVAVEPFLARPRKLIPLSKRLVLALPDSGIGERDRVELGSTASCKANVYQCRCALLKCLSRSVAKLCHRAGGRVGVTDKQKAVGL
ncbi:AAEL017401-PA, partial [Aedes aegypti]